MYVVDDDPDFSAFLRVLLSGVALTVETFSHPRDFLAAFDPAWAGLILLDLRLPEMSGLEVMRELRSRGATLPIIVMSAYGSAPLAAQAIKEGAVDYLEKPFMAGAAQAIVDSVQKGLRTRPLATDEARELGKRYALLSAREREVADLVRRGRSSKVIARTLGLSTRTVEGHRARILRKLGAENTAELVRLLALLPDDLRT